jgi:hypothetical protein
MLSWGGRECFGKGLRAPVEQSILPGMQQPDMGFHVVAMRA